MMYVQSQQYMRTSLRAVSSPTPCGCSSIVSMPQMPFPPHFSLQSPHSPHDVPDPCSVSALPLQLNLEIHHNQSLSPTVRFSALHNSRRLTRTLHIRVRWAECLYSLLWDDILAPESCFFRKAGVTSYISSSPDIVCGRVVPGPLVGFHSQLKRCQKSTRAPFDIGPFPPAEERTGTLVL